MVYEYSLDWFPGGIYWEIRVWFPASSSRFRFYCDINVTLMGLRLDYYDCGIKLSFIQNKKKKGA